MYTIFGANGFIGSNLVKICEEKKLHYVALGRNNAVPKANLGHIIYCIGITADFRCRQYDTVDAHVCQLLKIVKHCEFDTFTYLSSTRIYKNEDESNNEENDIQVNPLNTDDLYNISKILGEAICLNSGKKVRIIRLSNVYGDDFESKNFLSSIIRDSIINKKIILQTSLDSEKDYISVRNTIEIILKIVHSGKYSIYNVASGKKITHLQLVERIKELTSCEILVESTAKTIKYPMINICRIKEEFSFLPSNVLDDLPEMISEYKTKLRM